MSITKLRVKSAIRHNEANNSAKIYKGSARNSPMYTADKNKIRNSSAESTRKQINLQSTNVTVNFATTNGTHTDSQVLHTNTPHTMLLKIEPFVPSRLRKPLARSYSTLSSSSYTKRQNVVRNTVKPSKGEVMITALECGTSALPNVIRGPVLAAGTLSRRPTLRVVTRQRSKSTSSSNSASNRPSVGANLKHPYNSPQRSSVNGAMVTQQANGICRIARHTREQEKLPDRINYDKRGLTTIPIFENEPNLRLLSLQHNLISTFHIPREESISGKNDGSSEISESQTSISIGNCTLKTDVNNQRLPNSRQEKSLPLGNIQSTEKSLSPATPFNMLTTQTLKNGYANHTSQQQQQQQHRHKLLQKNLHFHADKESQHVLPSSSHMRFGLRKSKSFANNFAGHLNTNGNCNKNVKKGLTPQPHQRPYLIRTRTSTTHLKSFDSAATCNVVTATIDTVSSPLIITTENEENVFSASQSLDLHIKNKQLQFTYGAVFHQLVFLDLYDNQIERINNLDGLPSLSVLLLGKNRITDISGLASLKTTLRVLDLHGNKITSVSSNRINCLHELRSLNLAGNQIRQINQNDFNGLQQLKELNLKRNKLKRINGFQHLTALERLWLCHNDLHKVEDMASIAKAVSLVEVTIENNPVSLAGDCVSFLVSYLPKLQSLSQMPITEQVRKAAMTWRNNKELASTKHQHLTTEIFNSIRREEIISNARTNWELLRSQQLSQFGCANKQRTLKYPSDLDRIQEDTNENVYEEFIRLPPIGHAVKDVDKSKDDEDVAGDRHSQSSSSSLGPNVNSFSSCYSSEGETDDVPPKTATNNQQPIKPTSDFDETSTASPVGTDFSTKTTDSAEITQISHTKGVKIDKSTTSPRKQVAQTTNTGKCNSAVTLATTSIEFQANATTPNMTNQLSNQTTSTIVTLSTTTTSVPTSSTLSKRYMTSSLMRSQTALGNSNSGVIATINGNASKLQTATNNTRYQSKPHHNSTAQTSANANQSNNEFISHSSNTSITCPASNTVITSVADGYTTNVNASKSSLSTFHNQLLTVSATTTTTTIAMTNTTATSIKLTPNEREREQGGDYLIEICGRYLNVYGHGALRFIDKQWNPAKANDVHTLNFSYINFNNIITVLTRIKVRFPHAENFVFRETNIAYLGQLNALAELQGISSLFIDPEGNSITTKDLWRQYAIYRLSHWGLKLLNAREVTTEEVDEANSIYAGLSELILWSLPDAMLQPLLARLRLEESCTASKMFPKQWLLKPDNQSLRLVVGKEALQWKKANSNNQENHKLPTPQQVRLLQLQYAYDGNAVPIGNSIATSTATITTTTTMTATNLTLSTTLSSSSSIVPTTTITTTAITPMTNSSLSIRERGKIHITLMMENTCNAVEKLHKLETLWPSMLLEIVRNTLIDYSQLDVYVRNLMTELMK
uniref:Dynein axonemal assembly factor 1 homolog n=1 Tax=Glossina brevipalpis TaxID=37001 RepID=A0A1A9WLE7_9MUSC